MMLVNPLSIIIPIYILIFIFRPVLILYFEAESLDFEYIKIDDWLNVLYLVLISIVGLMAGAILSFVFTKNHFRTSDARKKFDFSALIFILYLTTFISMASIFLYGSALTNTLDRLESSVNYRFFFIFIIAIKVQQILTVYLFSNYLCKKTNHREKNKLLVVFCISPLLALFVSGRAAMFYMVLSFAIVYVILRNYKLTLFKFAKLLLIVLFMMYLAQLLGAVRIVLLSGNLSFSDFFDLLNYSNIGDIIFTTLVAFSWDYSVFDTLVRILNSNESFMYGYTNLSYLLAYIPRVVWPDKPYDQGFGLLMTQVFYGDIFSSTGSTFAGTIIGEGYWNFGIVGVGLYSFVFSYFIYRLYFRAIRVRSPYCVTLYAIALPLVFSIIRGGTDFMVQFLLMTIIPIWLLRTLVIPKKYINHEAGY